MTAEIMLADIMARVALGRLPNQAGHNAVIKKIELQWLSDTVPALTLWRYYDFIIPPLDITNTATG